MPVLHAGTAAHAATEIFARFRGYLLDFAEVTLRAQGRFEQRDWHALQRDAVERLTMYRTAVRRVVTALQAVLGESLRDRALWQVVKSDYRERLVGDDHVELAETFYNSVTRFIFSTVGVDAAIEFDDEPGPPGASLYRPVYRTYAWLGDTAAVLREILDDHPFQAPYEDRDRDLRLAAQALDRSLAEAGFPPPDEIDVVRSVFYRRKQAALVGRVRAGGRSAPIVLPLLNEERGIFIDAVLFDEAEVSILFSLTRSYFHVTIDCPRPLVEFLAELMPRKPIADLYIAIGHNKHGKTEIYRNLVRHVRSSSDKFVTAPGDRGMVMAVFTLPSYDRVFKIIKDEFAPPKATTRESVMEKYQLVFEHDRAGRLVDAQQFEHVRFDRARFSDELLAELLAVATDTVVASEFSVVVRHLYVERRLTPLNLFLRDAEPEAAREVVLDYGQVIKDLATTNIFCGDLLLKNFGVTRNRRVVFYDYDELCLVTECNFREIPAGDDDEEGGGEPWFYVGPNDVFPEEFVRFLGIQEPLKSLFLEAHGDLFTVEFWSGLKRRIAAGEVIDIFAYKQSRRLHASAAR